MTAAHNLYNREKKMWVKDILFYPAYTKGEENPEYGTWAGPKRAVVEPWIQAKTQKEAEPFDIGLVTLSPRKKTPMQIGNVVKPVPLIVGMKPTYATSWLTLGYPNLIGNLNGDNMWQCKGSWVDREEEGVIYKEGNFGYGASGGPWLFKQDSSYWVNAVTSSLVVGREGENQNDASYFGEWVLKFVDEYFR